MIPPLGRRGRSSRQSRRRAGRHYATRDLAEAEYTPGVAGDDSACELFGAGARVGAGWFGWRHLHYDIVVEVSPGGERRDGQHDVATT